MRRAPHLPLRSETHRRLGSVSEHDRSKSLDRARGAARSLMIADEIITEIRSRADIVAVIGQHVQLKKAGRSWKGLCPFHGEKTPSFNVMPEKGFFHCFGCHETGDVFKFVMHMEGKTFVEAVEQLGARFGVAVPKIEES